MFVPPENLLQMFYLWVGISKYVFKGIGVVIFCDYFYSNYVIGHFSNDFYADLKISRHITNNFVEGANSGMKKFIKGESKESRVVKWMLFNAKNTILGLGSKFKHSKLTTDCLVDFQNAMLENNYNHALKIICKKIATTGNQSKKTEKSQRLTEADSIKNFRIIKHTDKFSLQLKNSDMISTLSLCQWFALSKESDRVLKLKKFVGKKVKKLKE